MNSQHFTENARLLHYSDRADVSPPKDVEISVFQIPARSTALDLYFANNGNPGMPGAIVRVYQSVQGIEFEAARAYIPSTGGATRGCLLRHRGVGDWRVTLQAGSTGGQGDGVPPATLAYYAWGVDDHGPAFQTASPNPRRPCLWESLYVDGGPNPGFTPHAIPGETFTPLYIRQLICTLKATAGGNVWVQFITNVAGDVTVEHEVMLVDVGDVIGSDFRDAHALAVDNDGLLLPTGCSVALSSTPLITTPVAPVDDYVVTVLAELRV